jgi:hypothetical protein
MDNTRHFVAVTAASLSRLAAAVEEAAAVLDQRGGRRARAQIVKEAHFALGALQALDNSLSDFAAGLAPPTPLLRAEVDRLKTLRAGGRLPAVLRIVGGTDMEGRNGNAA